MNDEPLKNKISRLVTPHLPSNANRFRYSVFAGPPQVSSTFGLTVDPHPFDGKVVVITDEFVFVKTARTQFAVLDRSLVTTVPEIGDKVHVVPYIRRRFDGGRADTPEPAEDGSRRLLIGHAPAKLPIPEPQCPELDELIQQLETLPAPDGFRRITHMLVDANARDFIWVDPEPENIVSTPPAISCTVSTGKFEGQVTIIYDRGADAYEVELSQNGELVKRVDDIYFDMLGDVLEQWIDDGTWRRIQVTVTHPASKRKAA